MHERETFTKEDLKNRLGEPLLELSTDELTTNETSLGWESIQWLLFRSPHNMKVLSFMALNGRDLFDYNGEHALLLASFFKQHETVMAHLRAKQADIAQMCTGDIRPVPTSAQIINSRLERENEELRKSLQEEVEKRKDRERKACMWWAMWQLPSGFKQELEQLARERAQSQKWDCFEGK